MYEVTIVIDGIPQTLSVHAQDEITVQKMITNMYSGGKVEIINIRRV